MRKSNEKFQKICDIKISRNHYSYYAILLHNKGSFAVNELTKQHQNRVLLFYRIIANSDATAELKNCRIKNPPHLFGLLGQYIGSDKQ